MLRKKIIFFERQDWIEVPPDWSRTIVQGKSYETDSFIGKNLWDKIENPLERYLQPIAEIENDDQLIYESKLLYGKSILTKIRLGQGAFRVLVTDAYTRRCSITGERTLPVLEAAHIKPYSVAGPNAISNGLLLRSDIDKLFDASYLTITRDHKTEVSKRIKEEFENGREYYQFHGKILLYLPKEIANRPKAEFIESHNEKEIENLGIVKADVYSVFLGTNDWWAGRPVGVFADYVNNTGNTTVYGSFRIIINKLRSLNKDARIILITPMQRADFVYINDMKNNAWGSYKDKNGQSLEAFATAVKAISKYEHFDCIDLFHKKGMGLKNLVNYKRLKDPKTGMYKNYPYPEFINIP